MKDNEKHYKKILSDALTRKNAGSPVWKYFTTRIHTHPNKNPSKFKYNEKESKIILESNLNNSERMRPRALYIHIPFCPFICQYCHFFRIQKNDSDFELFVNAVVKQIDAVSRYEWVQSKEFDSIYFGGGTPTVLPSEHLIKIINYIRKKIPVNDDLEISVESRITGIDKKYLLDLVNVGVNRISFGVQSFQSKYRKKLNRICSSEKIYKTLNSAREVKFNSVCIDLMYALPQQTLEDWERDIRILESLDLSGCSIYRLNIHSNTKLAQKIQQGQIQHGHSIRDEYDLFRISDDRLGNLSEWERITPVNYGKINEERAIYLRYHNDSECDVLAIGPGAMGQVGNCLYENNPDIVGFMNEDYAKDIGRCQVWKTVPEYFTAWKWHRLSLKFSITPTSELYWLVPDMYEIIEILQELNLVEPRANNTLVLTNDGRFWARNVFYLIQEAILSTLLNTPPHQ